jgi:type VI secretion system protein ImpH
LLQNWMQQLLGHEYEWDAQLTLRDKEVPSTRMGAASRLGWTSWLGNRPRSKHADDVMIPS